MFRQPIRNTDSSISPKPRVFDVIIDDDGGINLEVKTSKKTEIIRFCVVLNQIREALQAKEAQEANPSPPSKD